MRSTIALSATMLFIVFGAWTANLVVSHPHVDTAMAVSPMTAVWD
jgi:hypothetical protein